MPAADAHTAGKQLADRSLTDEAWEWLRCMPREREVRKGTEPITRGIAYGVPSRSGAV